MPVAFGTFDNRDEPLRRHPAYRLRPHVSPRRRLTQRLRRRRLPLHAVGAPHLAFETTHERFVYAYLRKNGCTSMKNFLLAHYNISYKHDLDKINQLVKHLSVMRYDEIQNVQSLLVLREPVLRLCSLFRNKLIERPDSSFLPQRVAARTSRDPAEMTFHEFVELYLTPCIVDGDTEALDVHCLPQAVQLWPIHYNRVFLLKDLPQAAHELFGAETAQRYFERKVNASANELSDVEAADRPASELRAAFDERHQTPSDRALLTADLEQRLRELYAVDYALMEMAGLTTAAMPQPEPVTS